jgi:flagellar motor protein MotB
MDLRMRQKSVLNVWPAFTDVSIAMLLIFLFFLFIQFVSNSKLILKMQMEKKQETIEIAFKKRFANEIRQGIISIERDGNLQRFMFSDRILFNTDKAKLRPLGRMTLTAVGRLLQQHKTDEEGQRLYKSIQIEGHTDNVPIISPDRSNWELSSDRAIAVLRLFVDHIGIDPRTTKATGYAEFRPAAGDSSNIKRANNTQTKRAKNRRIEIVLVYSETEEGK